MASRSKKGTKAGKVLKTTECSHCKTEYPRVEDLPWTNGKGEYYCNSCGAFLPRAYQRKINTA